MVSCDRANIQVVGLSELGKTFYLASIAKNIDILSDGIVKAKIKGLQKDSILKTIIKNPSSNMPSKGRRSLNARIVLKCPSNAFFSDFCNLSCYDERGGVFSDFLDYKFEAKKSQFKELFSNEFSNTQGVIILLSAEQFFGCPNFNPNTCSGKKKLKCEKNEYKNCLINNAFSVKRVINAVASLTEESDIPVAIAITHSAKFDKSSLERISVLLDDYLQDEYGDSLHKPNYYFVDSLEALNIKKSFYCKRAVLPVIDIIYHLIDKISVQEQSGFSKFAFGNFNEMKRLFKESLLTQLEYYGGY